MAAYISVPRDLAKVKSKVAFNLTKRQLVCFGTAALIGVPLFFVLRDSGGNTAATLGMMAVMLPAFFLGMYEKNGQPLEKLLSYYVQSRFVRPKIRPYKTNNYYAILMKGGATYAIDNFADRIADAENALQNLEQQKQAAEVEVAKPFAQEEELAEKSARLAELNALLNIDRDRSSSQDTPEESKETEAPATRPSVLAALGEKTNQPEPVKPFRSYYDKDGDAR